MDLGASIPLANKGTLSSWRTTTVRHCIGPLRVYWYLTMPMPCVDRFGGFFVQGLLYPGHFLVEVIIALSRIKVE